MEERKDKKMAQGWRNEYSRYKSFFLNISELYRKKRDLRMFLEILLSLTTISFFAVFALRPTLLTISQLVVDIKSKKETIAVMDTKIRDLATAQQLLLQEASRLSFLETSVFDTPKPEVIARQVEGLSDKNMVNILGLSIEETELKPLPENSDSISLSLNAAGSYWELYSFLKDVENLRLPVQIDTFQIGALTLVISGRIPYLGSQETRLDKQ